MILVDFGKIVSFSLLRISCLYKKDKVCFQVLGLPCYRLESWSLKSVINLQKTSLQLSATAILMQTKPMPHRAHVDHMWLSLDPLAYTKKGVHQLRYFVSLMSTPQLASRSAMMYLKMLIIIQWEINMIKTCQYCHIVPPSIFFLRDILLTNLYR